MVIVDFLKKNHNVALAFFNHGTKHSQEAQSFLIKYARENGLDLYLEKINKEKDKRQSWEEYWRIERYKFLNSLNGTVITCHHLDDVLETYIFSNAHGCSKLIPYSNKNIVRPFLLNTKDQIKERQLFKNVAYIQDESNLEDTHMRNFIRSNTVPQYKIINPGIYKVLRKTLQQVLNKQE